MEAVDVKALIRETKKQTLRTTETLLGLEKVQAAIASFGTGTVPVENRQKLKSLEDDIAKQRSELDEQAAA